MSEMKELIIDPEFASQIPPLTPDEYDKLEYSILEEGAAINAIVTWNGIIIHGHHRYQIIQKYPERNIHYSVYKKFFSDRNAAKAWMFCNQLGRRNLTPAQRKYLIGKQYEAEKASHGKDSKAVRDSKGRFTLSGQNDHSGDEGRTRERIAQENNVNESYVRRAEYFAKDVDLAEDTVPGTRQEILSGNIRPTDKAVAELFDTDDPDERKGMIAAFHESGKSTGDSVSGCCSAEDGEDDESAPEVTIKEIKKIYADMLAPKDCVVDENDVIAEMDNALQNLKFRWNKCIEMYSYAAKGASYRSRRDELIREGIEYLRNFKKRKRGNKIDEY